MLALFNGMAVLVIEISMMILAYALISKLNWKKMFSERNYRFAKPLCLFLSIGLGHLVASGLLKIVEILHQTVINLVY